MDVLDSYGASLGLTGIQLLLVIIVLIVVAYYFMAGPGAAKNHYTSSPYSANTYAGVV